MTKLYVHGCPEPECRDKLEAAVAFCARELGYQPLSIREMMARLLIEDFAELDADATADWLDANMEENAAYNSETKDAARQNRRKAFTRLAQAEIAQRETP